MTPQVIYLGKNQMFLNLMLENFVTEEIRVADIMVILSQILPMVFIVCYVIQMFCLFMLKQLIKLLEIQLQKLMTQ
ncbi:hypothetical protein SDC9_60351 [bioreactor metagenome]|uniref:Uncharacterized protein n=1 Tax=bioreactor metagenome TaxID=1076179 RepID=A0A644XE10_9ZZZZ